MLVFWQPEKGRLPVRVGELDVNLWAVLAGETDVNIWDKAQVKCVDGVHNVPFAQLRWVGELS